MRMAVVSIAAIYLLLGGRESRAIPIPYPESELGPPPGMPTGGLDSNSADAVLFQR
jgi:hypothetical protein